jgi:hypothetical protein
MRPSYVAAALGVALVVTLGGAALAADPCPGFKWDIAKEHALFLGSATVLSAGKNAAVTPMIAVDRLYKLSLVPQTEVAFAATPGRQAAPDGAFAGLALVKLKVPGNYRVSLDQGAWVDLIANGQSAPTRDFQGQHRCDAPHKIVEFELTRGTQYILQISGTTQTSVRLTLTAATPQRP